MLRDAPFTFYTNLRAPNSVVGVLFNTEKELFTHAEASRSLQEDVVDVNHT